MGLRDRISRLEEEAPPPRRRLSAPIPADLTGFARGILRGEFAPGDVDPTSIDQSSVLAEFAVALTTLTAAHQQWADRTGWGRQLQDAWERASLRLEPGEMRQLRALAVAAHPQHAGPPPRPAAERAGDEL